MAHINNTKSNLIELHRSLSLKSNASQDRILFELEQLKYSFKEALRLSLRPTGGRSLCQGDNSDARVSRNLHKLAAAAKQFHSAASSTSGTTRDGSNVSWHALSLVGDFPEHKQQRVRDFIDHQLHYPAPVSVASGQETLARASSPQRVHSPILSPLVTTSAVLDVATAPKPAQMDSDDDDEDYETDDEQEYFDGLEELARDRMLNRDYAKAIDFLTRAMARDIGATSTGNEFREIQILLALCHFFQGDWKKATPIVTSLARVLDEVTCNLLHALALYQLSEYSLDDALKTCRKSMNGKKRLLKASSSSNSAAGGDDGGYPDSDYAETVALFATIHHISGDPIRAEIFHRRLPEGFEYQHPASAIDFVRKHPRILPVVLGSDGPVASAAGVFGWPDGTRRSFLPAGPAGSPTAEQDSTGGGGGSGLCRKATVAESPLRTRFAFFERYESDTCKIMVEEEPSPCSPADSGIDMDADDERSPVGEESSSEVENTPPLEPTPPLRLGPTRRVTRIFTSRRPRNRAAGDDEPASGGESDQSPETPALPASRWNKFGFTRPKTLLRKRVDRNALGDGQPSTAKRTRTLRLGIMELTLRTRSFPAETRDITRPDGWFPSGASQDNTATHCNGCFEVSAEPPQHSRAVVDVSLGHSDQSMTSDSPSQSSEESLRRHPSLNAHVGPHVPAQSTATPPPLPTCSVTGGDGAASSSSTRYDRESLIHACELQATERTFELHDVALSPIALIDRYISDQWESLGGWSPYGEPTPLTAGISIVSERCERLSGISEEPSETQDYDARPLVVTPARVQSCTASTDLAGLLGRVAGLVVSLPDASDTDKRLAVRAELETVLGLLDGISNDPLLASDLRRIITSLDAGRGSSHDDDDDDDVDDSGYETGDSQQEEKQQEQQQEQPLVHSPRQATPAASLDAAPFHARLRPTPSFVAGDDAKFTRREPSEEEEEEHVHGGGGGPGAAADTAPDRRVLLALRPYARPRGGPGLLERKFSFTAGVDDGLYISGRRSIDEYLGIEDISGRHSVEEEELGLADTSGGGAGGGCGAESDVEDVVAKKQVLWALEREVLVGDVEKSRMSMKLSRVKMLASRFW